MPRPVRDTAHAVISRDIGWYVAECLEMPVVAQGRTIDEVVAGLRLALERRLGMDDASKFGLTRSPRVIVSFEFSLSRGSRR
ncbi:MAG: type II toxin-antitoxin system HicB family antitoxin [Acidobacteria bacterium]|nr:type II toxin-antitoxin system HicB family antitoxin [Acidobacteriota bacterium]